MRQFSENTHRFLRLIEQLRDKRHGATAARLRELNLSFTHMRALHLIANAEMMAMKDLAEQLCLTPPSVTAATRRLVQSGLIQRAAYAEDSRVALLSLTHAGQELLDEVSRDQLAHMEQLLRGLTPAEQNQFLDLLEQAVGTLRAGSVS